MKSKKIQNICDTYELGKSHGMSRDGVAVLCIDPELSEAWQIGYSKGEKVLHEVTASIAKTDAPGIDGRPSRDEYFMGMAKLAATRSTCMRRKVGAVAVKNDHILSTGYNGAPRGLPHCEDAGCIRERDGIPSGEKHELCRGVHAEQNLICQAAYHGVSLAGADIYCTNQPCSICAKMLLNVGVGRVCYVNGYPDDMTQEILGDRLFKLKGD